MLNLEKAAAAHSEQEQRLMEQMATQKQLACKYSERVSELEKDGRLRQLELRETKKELETEKALASKLYDDVRRRKGERREGEGEEEEEEEEGGGIGGGRGAGRGGGGGGEGGGTGKRRWCCCNK